MWRSNDLKWVKLEKLLQIVHPHLTNILFQHLTVSWIGCKSKIWKGVKYALSTRSKEIESIIVLSQ